MSDRSGTPPRKLLLVGGSSEIGLAIARRVAADGSGSLQVHLLGRDQQRLREGAANLEQGGCEVSTGHLDADDLDSHEQAITDAFAGAGGFELVVIAVGILGAQDGVDADQAAANAVMRTNFLGTGSLLLHCLRALERQTSGTLVVLSSVAAERPRASNAIYSATKAGLDSLAQGLADRSHGSGARVLVVRPGFVTTRMTKGLKPAPFATTADAVAAATVRALHGRAHTIWVPGSLRFVFAVLRHMPRPLFRRLAL
jgi:decaprenylphospho-beta-D-erythro-pentofuranosid-2-ulose 2-reductase